MSGQQRRQCDQAAEVAARDIPALRHRPLRDRMVKDELQTEMELDTVL